MLNDAFGNPLHTTSAAARDAYVDGMTRYLEAQPGVEEALDVAIAADEGFALAYAIKARNAQVYDRMGEAKAWIAQAIELGRGVTGQAQAHLQIFDHLINGRVRDGYATARAHLLEYPRDAMVAQTSLGVFSLIGFSGQAGREAEHLALAEILAPAYGEDGWFLAQLAFAQMEAGQVGPAGRSIEGAMARAPHSAHGAHIRAHLYYELGETQAGLDYLSGWMAGYDRAGMMHCHNAWHIALWSLAIGDEAAMWRIVDADLNPKQTQSPALNVMTDLAALYYRAEMAGVEVSRERWRDLSHFAAQGFAKPGLGFADVHAALAHAMAGQAEPLARIVEGATGPVADLVVPCGRAFDALARQDWREAEIQLIPVMAAHERLGGSRAQRDLIEYAMLQVLIRQGKADEARRLIAIRRPMIDRTGAVAGLREE